MDLPALGARVREKRLLHGLNTRDAAAAAGIPTEAWELLEQGEAPELELDDLITVAESLGCDFDDLLIGDPELSGGQS